MCGITNLEDALAAIDAGANALGFVFHEKSPRYVTLKAAQEIVRELPPEITTVGVFLNEQPERIEEIAGSVGLAAVQLHGTEHKWAGWARTKREVFVAVPPDELLRSIADTPSDRVKAIFMDASNGKGKPFPWSEALTSVQAAQQLFPVVIAGGLTQENVAEMMSILNPWGVDVSSGVERGPGKKDPQKVKAFVNAVRQADGER